MFACLFLDSQNRLLNFDKLFHGTINGAQVQIREVLKAALKHNAKSVILAHNHPSGVPEPSRDDKLITQELQTALAFIGVALLDHIIVGDGLVTTFSGLGLI